MRTLIAIPCMDSVPTQFAMSLSGLQKTGEVKQVYSVSSLIYDARNSLARQAIAEKFDRVLWLDSDMVFSPDLFNRLSNALDDGRDMVSGIYFTRKPPIKPVIFSEAGYEHVEGAREVKPVAETMYDYPEGIFEVAAVGFGGVMMNVSLLKEVEEKYGLPFAPMLGFGEDISFCLRVRDLGKKIWCDSSIKMGHVGFRIITEETYRESRNA